MTERGRFLLAHLTVGFIFSCPFVAQTWADGGTVRLAQRQGAYQITVFTAPVPLRAGIVDISVFIQDAVTGAPLPEVRVGIGVAPSGQPQERVRARATTDAATNKLYQAASFELPSAGLWQIDVEIEGPQGQAQVRLDVEAAEPQPRWAEMAFWIALPVLPILLFSIHQVLVRQSPRRPPASGSNTKEPS